MVEELAADAPYPALREAILPRRLHTSAFELETRALEELDNFGIEFRIMIQNHVPVGIGFRKSLPQLLHDPGGRRMAGNMAGQNPAPLVLDHEKTIQNPESQGGHGKEIHGYNGFSMIRQKSPPALLRIAAASPRPQRAGHRAFREGEAELPPFAMNLWCTPIRILSRHAANESPNFFTDLWTPASWLGPPAPVPAKAGPMPTDHGLRLH